MDTMRGAGGGGGDKNNKLRLTSLLLTSLNSRNCCKGPVSEV